MLLKWKISFTFNDYYLHYYYFKPFYLSSALESYVKSLYQLMECKTLV